MIALFVHELAITKILAGQCAILSKSWSYLFTAYGYGDNESGSNGARSYPTSYGYTGAYYWQKGMLYSQSISGSYWSSSKKGLNSYGLDIRDTRLSKTHTANACFGYTLRCVTRI